MTSGARIAKLEPSALDAEQRSLYDAIAGGRRAQGPQLFRLADADGRLEGPFNAFLLQPRLGSALQALGASVRYDTGLDDRCREIAILVVAAHWRSDFEWYAHEAVGRAAGLGDAELAALREGRHAELAGPESVVARTAAALVARGDLDDAEYARGRRPPRPGRAVRAAHPRRLLRDARAAAPRVPRPRSRGPRLHRLDTAAVLATKIDESYFRRTRASQPP